MTNPGADDSVRPREASAARRRPRRGLDAGTRGDGGRGDVPAPAPGAALRGRAHLRHRARPRIIGHGGVRRRVARPRHFHRRGRAVLLPPPRRGRRADPLLREHAGRVRRALAPRAGRPLPAADTRGSLPPGVSRLRRRRARGRARRRDRGCRALDSHAARHLGHRRPPGPAAQRRAPTRMSEALPPTWRVPPWWVLLVGVLAIVCAELGGASMVRFKVELTRWARGAMLARPAVHGLVGVRDVDERILDEALVKFDAGLRLFHMHAEGMGLVIIATTMVAATVARSAAVRRSIIALLTTGGAGYPVGYLVWSALIPSYGLERAKTIAEWLVWIPFGSATIVGLWWLAGLVALRTAPARYAPPRS